MGCNRTRGSRTVAWRTNHWATSLISLNRAALSYTTSNTEPRRTLHWAKSHPNCAMSYDRTYWAKPHPTDLRRTLLSYAAHCWDTPHPTALRRTLLSYTAPCWATPRPTELRRILLSYAAPWLSYAAPFWATPHATELRRILLSYAACYWATLNATDLRRTLTELNDWWVNIVCMLYGAQIDGMNTLECSPVSPCTICVVLDCWVKTPS